MQAEFTGMRVRPNSLQTGEKRLWNQWLGVPQSSSQILDGLNRFEHDDKRFPELGPKESRELGTPSH